MRCIFIFTLSIISVLASATDYYVSSTGSDSADGLSESTAWQTIAKVNSVFPALNPGDKILFKSGDIFYGSLKITKSGSANLPITIGSYGSEGKSIITGFTTLSPWTYEGDGIYSTLLTCESSPEMVTVDGTQFAMGRWPNSKVWPETQTWASIDSYVGVTSLTDAELSSTGITWTGAEVVVRNSTRNRISRYPITNHTGTTLTFSGGNTAYPLGKDWGYFVQNDKRTLDQFGEWYYDTKTSTFYMYFGTENTINHTIKTATLNSLIVLGRGITNIQIENLFLNGSNNTAIYGLGYNHNSKIENCNISLTGHNGINTFESNDIRINNSIIENCNDNAISLKDNCESTYIGNNEIKNIGLFPGMGQALWESAKAIYLRGNDNAIVEYNRIKNSGFSGIHFSGNSITIRNNFIDTFGNIKEDCGGIQYGGGSTYSNMKILNNILLNGLGSTGGKPVDYFSWVAGIYLDYYTTGGVEISDNTIANVKHMGGILISGSQNVIINNNTVFDCESGIRMQEIGGLGSPPRNVSLTTGNIIFAKNISYKPLLLYSINNDFDQFGNFDYNYYARPLDNAKPIILGISGKIIAKSLEEWQMLYEQDLNSKISPVALKDTADIDFYYNPTEANISITLVQPMLDVKGKSYVNSVTLAPFSSIILMVDPDPPVPVVPVYVSSLINNFSPTKVELTYTVNLDPSSLPLPSDFTVMVNGIARNVISVEISGNKVILILASPVLFGDMVSVSYTRNPGRPLQTSSLGLAANLTDETVKNNIADPSEKNSPPNISVSYEEDVFSGFVCEIDASATIDDDNDDLTFSWKTPPDIPVSSITGPVIRFLTPIVSTPQTLTFQLSVNDGKVESSTSLSVTNKPYKPELRMGNVKIIEASNFFQPHHPINVDDNNLNTRWSVEGDNQWITISLAEPLKINHIQVALIPDQHYESYFDLFASSDNIFWEPLLQNGVSCGFSGYPQNFNLPADKLNTEYSYVKLLAHGNELDTWNNYSEIKIFGSPGDSRNSPDDPENISIYPNPARDHINVMVLEPVTETQTLRVADMAGNIRFETTIDPGAYNTQIPVNLSSGVYIVQVLMDKLIRSAQTIIITR